MAQYFFGSIINSYVYEETHRDEKKGMSSPNKTEKGYKDMYGYEDAEPDVENKTPTQGNVDYVYGETPSLSSSERMARRSSLKTSEHYVPRRRASIAHIGEIEVMLPDHTKVKRRTSISFDEKDQVKEVEPVPSMVKQIKELWTTLEECDETKQELRRMVALAKNCPAKLARSSVCTRGIERHLRDDAANSVSLSRVSLLDLQQRQKENGEYDDETLRDVYKCMSDKSTRDAQLLAQRDYVEVKHDYRMTKRMIARQRRTSRRSSM